MASIPEIFQSMEYGPAPESAGPAHTWLDTHQRQFALFIGPIGLHPLTVRRSYRKVGIGTRRA